MFLTGFKSLRTSPTKRQHLFSQVTGADQNRQFILALFLKSYKKVKHKILCDEIYITRILMILSSMANPMTRITGNEDHLRQCCLKTLQKSFTPCQWLSLTLTSNQLVFLGNMTHYLPLLNCVEVETATDTSLFPSI